MCGTSSAKSSLPLSPFSYDCKFLQTTFSHGEWQPRGEGFQCISIHLKCNVCDCFLHFLHTHIHTHTHTFHLTHTFLDSSSIPKHMHTTIDYTYIRSFCSVSRDALAALRRRSWLQEFFIFSPCVRTLVNLPSESKKVNICVLHTCMGRECECLKGMGRKKTFRFSLYDDLSGCRVEIYAHYKITIAVEGDKGRCTRQQGT